MGLVLHSKTIQIVHLNDAELFEAIANSFDDSFDAKLVHNNLNCILTNNAAIRNIYANYANDQKRKEILDTLCLEVVDMCLIYNVDI